MLDALRFVAAAVAKKDYVPELTHFRIKGGRVTAFNGILALSTDIDVDLDIMPHAAKMLTAIRACEGVISLHMTPAKRLSIKAGKFKSFVECLDDDGATPVLPEGQAIELGPNFLPGLKAVAPIMGVDASRPWAMGVKLQRESMYATNNVMLVEYWHGTTIPVDVVIPAQAVKELLRINEAPVKVQVTDHSISFWFNEKRWMRSALLPGESWPIERMTELLSRKDGEQIALPEDFEDSVAKLKPFLGDHGSIYMTGEAISTSKTEGEGTSFEMQVPGVNEMQAYHHQQLTLLAEVAKTIDWTAYPAPCMFRGDRLRGALIGQRV